MNTQELLKTLSEKIRSGELDRAEVLRALGVTPPTVSPSVPHTRASGKISSSLLTRGLYILGAAIALIGIIIFVGQIWDTLSSFGRVSITLGLGVLVATLGSILLLKGHAQKSLGSIFHLIGGVLVPLGTVVLLREAGFDTPLFFTLSFSALFVVYAFLSYVHKNTILIFFTIALGTITAYLALATIFDQRSAVFFEDAEYFSYLTMILGVSYLILAHTYRAVWGTHLTNLLFFFGSIGFFLASFFQVFDSIFWQFIYFALVFGGLYVAVYLKTRIVLLISTLFLLVHISYVTGEYFADSIGWPIALVILGFVFIALGYGSITLSNTFIKKSL